MGWCDWFREKLGLRVVRDVSRLDARNVAGKEYVGEDEGTPLRPHSLRLVRRDKRLFPKPGGRVRWGKRVRHMTTDEARRLFADTLRTKRRDLRDLLPDEARLRALGLPVWRDEADLAEGLGVTVPRLRHYTIHRNAERTPHYVTFARPKRRGGERLICAPKRELKAIQRRLHAALVSKLPMHDAAHGFREGRSVRTGAEPHVGQAVVIKLDVTEFFHQVHFGRVRGLLITCGYGFVVASVIAALVTEAERQPVDLGDRVYYVPVGPRRCVQGAPTSPGLCNAVAKRLDQRMSGLARRHGFVYTRYADDLTFSGDDPAAVGALLGAASAIAAGEGFALNREKTRVMRAGQRQTVTGVTVNEALGLSRTARRRLRAALHQEATAEDRARNEGSLAWVQMLNPEQAAKLRAGKRGVAANDGGAR